MRNKLLKTFGKCLLWLAGFSAFGTIVAGFQASDYSFEYDQTQFLYEIIHADAQPQSAREELALDLKKLYLDRFATEDYKGHIRLKIAAFGSGAYVGLDSATITTVFYQSHGEINADLRDKLKDVAIYGEDAVLARSPSFNETLFRTHYLIWEKMVLGLWFLFTGTLLLCKLLYFRGQEKKVTAWLDKHPFGSQRRALMENLASLQAISGLKDATNSSGVDKAIKACRDQIEQLDDRGVKYLEQIGKDVVADSVSLLEIRTGISVKAGDEPEDPVAQMSREEIIKSVISAP